MVEVTHDFNTCRPTLKAHKFWYYLSLWVLLLFLYTPEILNANIEQEMQNMSRVRTPQELEFLKYITPFKYFDPLTLLNESRLDITFVWISAGIIAVALFGGYVTYSRRDLYI